MHKNVDIDAFLASEKNGFRAPNDRKWAIYIGADKNLLADSVEK